MLSPEVASAPRSVALDRRIRAGPTADAHDRACLRLGVLLHISSFCSSKFCIHSIQTQGPGLHLSSVSSLVLDASARSVLTAVFVKNGERARVDLACFDFEG